MNSFTDVVPPAALALVWLAAGLLADGLPTARNAAELRRRAALPSVLAAAGAAGLVAVPLTALLGPGDVEVSAAVLLPAVPAAVALAASRPRLARIRRGAGAFATAPSTPLPPGLRAAAAHPLVAVPLLVTGLAAALGVPVAAGVVVPGVAVGAAAGAAAVAAAGAGLRAGLRHHRLRASAPAASARPAGAPRMAAERSVR